ncbi:MAG TPA: cbb3-type cytochrome oxidase assembly protein CcoS [Pseudomonas sp.]|uniref:Cbb3-type cytochrome oxidase assembly protein CcoS n=1 Tax=Stutzerimonas frequens TaxID=2968969 RepID=A0AA47E5I2_9GAMM|nr:MULTISPECIES: cbb3-type cytochrome oxidase assembly protein CcoS [Stutzerimonas]MAL92281.1 cbb3-type cytochrome oxidase assembly protein CcoS [Pseudomonas sp.]MEC7473937.1 cbb3-type cytochrome oxidase assembly protein CcoS [Pseudomonadota bacterium]TDL93614.1 cbb3-type cytochrome oxidase assembly protein CcoS [Stutzerimonas stutzeri ATCC 17588 = LMG 11199]AWT10555.1 cbb3-type cytochrome oxidase assembly protein CcoS [Stutzerimonas frequens]KZX51978.1 cytochrome C oxidase subunit II [Stutzer
MAALYILIPVAVVLVALAIWVFFWAVDSGQFDDLDGPAHSILFDDEEPQRPSSGGPQETDEQQQEQRKGE